MALTERFTRAVDCVRIQHAAQVGKARAGSGGCEHSYAFDYALDAGDRSRE